MLHERGHLGDLRGRDRRLAVPGAGTNFQHAQCHHVVGDEHCQRVRGPSGVHLLAHQGFCATYGCVGLWPTGPFLAAACSVTWRVEGAIPVAHLAERSLAPSRDPPAAARLLWAPAVFGRRPPCCSPRTAVSAYEPKRSSTDRGQECHHADMQVQRRHERLHAGYGLQVVQPLRAGQNGSWRDGRQRLAAPIAGRYQASEPADVAVLGEEHQVPSAKRNAVPPEPDLRCRRCPRTQHREEDGGIDVPLRGGAEGCPCR
mmetsp:Transcript_37094/g.80617  ORF Transcript_37094/g.80617 Transcript_37094/m.80617 type:complete len:258 (-) Transcript_37094:571-1344(-)